MVKLTEDESASKLSSDINVNTPEGKKQLRERLKSYTDLIGSDERYELEDILDELEQEVVHGDNKTFHIGDDEEG